MTLVHVSENDMNEAMWKLKRNVTIAMCFEYGSVVTFAPVWRDSECWDIVAYHGQENKLDVFEAGFEVHCWYFVINRDGFKTT